MGAEDNTIGETEHRPIETPDEAATDKIEPVAIEALDVPAPPKSGEDEMARSDREAAERLAHQIKTGERGGMSGEVKVPTQKNPDALTPPPVENVAARAQWLKETQVKALHDEEKRIDAEYASIGFFKRMGGRARELRQRKARVIKQIGRLGIREFFDETFQLPTAKLPIKKKIAGIKTGIALREAENLPKAMMEAQLSRTPEGAKRWEIYQARLAQLETLQSKRGSLSKLPWNDRPEKKRLDQAIEDKTRQVNLSKGEYDR